MNLVLRALLLCNIFYLLSPNPIVSIMMRRRRNTPYLHVSNGLIVTSSLVATTMYPSSTIPTSLLCVLVDPRRTEILIKQDLRKYCLQVKEFITSSNKSQSSNFSLLRLYGDIIFSVGVTHSNFLSPAPNYTSTQCEVFLNLRSDQRLAGIYARNEVLSVIKERNGELNVEVKLLDRTRVCGLDNGLPLICRGVIVGLLSMGQEPLCGGVDVYGCIGWCRLYAKGEEFELWYVDIQEIEREYQQIFWWDK